MTNVVEELDINSTNSVSANVLKSATGKNQSFYRTNRQGEKVCWMAVDSDSGVIDIRDVDGNSLLIVDAKNKNLRFNNKDLIQSFDEKIKDLSSSIGATQQDVDSVAETVGNFKLEGIMLPNNGFLSANQNNQLTLNGKVFKGEKGEKGDTGKDGSDGRDGTNGLNGKDGIDGKDGSTGPQGEQGPQGDPGIDGKDGRNGVDGINGRDGRDGKNGRNGRDGKDADEVTLNYNTVRQLTLIKGKSGTLFDDTINVLRNRPVKIAINFRQSMRVHAPHDLNKRKTNLYIKVGDEIVVHRQYFFEKRSDAFLPDHLSFNLLSMPVGKNQIKVWYSIDEMDVELKDLSVLISHI